MHDGQQETPQTDSPHTPEAPAQEWQPTSNTPADGRQPSFTPEPVQWTASEFVAHQKNSSWYALLGGAAAVAAVLVYLLTRDKITVAMILIAAIAMGIFAGRKPRTLQYQLDASGVRIAQKLYPYGLFKSFSVIDEGPLSSIVLMPLKRFMPSISMYYEPSDEAVIVNMLSAYLPYEERQRDAVDSFMHRIRF